MNIQHFCCSEYGWSLDYVNNYANLVNMFLLMRQKLYTEGAKGISLMDKEMINQQEKTWEQMLLENRLMWQKKFEAEGLKNH